MAVSFATTIKPYFTEVDRKDMMDPNHTGGYTVDLWSASDVKANWDAINNVIGNAVMPPPEGWPQDMIDKFQADFKAWKDGGYQP
jgi:hypothetical protein